MHTLDIKIHNIILTIKPTNNCMIGKLIILLINILTNIMQQHKQKTGNNNFKCSFIVTNGRTLFKRRNMIKNQKQNKRLIQNTLFLFQTAL